MSLIRTSLYLILCFFTFSIGASQRVFYWSDDDESGNWTRWTLLSGNNTWSLSPTSAYPYANGYPNLPDDKAIFNGINDHSYAELDDFGVTIGYLTIDTADPQNPINISSPNGYKITFDSSTAPLIQILQGQNHVIETGLILKQTLPISINSNCSLSISGAIENGSGVSGITQSGTGILTLGGANTYTGPTSLSSGTLLINGSLGDTAVTVSSGATLGGNGTIGATTTTVTNNGTIAPGSDATHIGTLTINGNYTQNNLGNIQFKLRDFTQYDTLLINTGSANLLGAITLKFTNDAKFSTNDELTLINNKLGAGIFDLTSQLITLNMPPQLKATISQDNYGAKTLYVKFQEVSAPVDSHHSLSKTVFSLARSPLIFIDRHLDRTRQLFRGYHSKNNQNNYAYSFPKNINPDYLTAQSPDDLRQIPPQVTHKPFPQYRFYMGPIGSVGEMKSLQNQSGFHSWSVGALAGFDFLHDYSGWGLVTAYEKLDADVKNHWGSFDVHSLSLNGYGTYSPSCHKNFFIEGIAGMGYQWQFITRDAYLAFTKSSPESFSGNLVLGTGYNIVRDSYTLAPKVSLQYMGYHIDSYKERNGGLQNLSYEDVSEQSLRPILSLTLMRNASGMSCFQVLPELHIRYQRELLDPNSTLQFTGPTLVGTNNITLIGGGRDYIFVGASVQLRTSKHFSFDGSYDYEWNSRFHTNYFYLGMNYLF